ncbi:hypothetical protein FRC12_017131 [Ceratobasidium sp. 428]|nr:hypothetical protein FRC12_017131 [Ceratobasidium sp. 428]
MKEHGPYPSVGKSHISWPSRREGDRLIPVHRFDFNETYNSPRNNDSFLAWVEYSLNHGPAVARIPEPSDSVFNRATVTAACAKQYGYLKRRFKDMLANQAAPLIGIKCKEEDLDAPEFNPLDTLAASGASDNGVGGLIGGELGGEGVDNPFMGFDGSIGTAAAGWPIPPNPVDYNEILAAQAIQAKPEKVGVAKNLREALWSRRNTKLTIRTRKRHLLPPADEKYKGPKYDSYFTFGAMSEDETIEETNANGKKTQKFQARAWDFASDELVQIREAIDKVTDPVTSKQTERLRGPSKPGPPNKSRGVDTGMRTWMIKPEVMQQNPQWIHESRVYQSGPEWGESEPVKTEKPASKRVKVEAALDLSLAQQTQGDWLQAKREVEKYSAMRRTDNNPGPST